MNKTKLEIIWVHTLLFNNKCDENHMEYKKIRFI